MPLSTEEAAEMKGAYTLMSADELRAQKGDDAERDALIDEVLALGKSVETKGSAFAMEKAGTNLDQEPAAGTKKDQDLAAAKDEKQAGDDDEDDEGDDDAAAAAAAASVKADTKADAAAKDGAAGDQGVETVEVKDLSAEVPPLNLAPLDARLEENLAALDTAKAEQFQKLMDGEITAAEYSKTESKYLRDRDELRETRTHEAQWFTQVHAFKVEAARTAGINYDTDAAKGQALDDWCKRLGANPENAGRPSAWFLEQAHKKVMVEFDITPGSAPPAAKDGKQPAPANKAADKSGRAPNLSNIPPTLGGLPAAAEIDAGDSGEFAHLDKLTGMDYERALAALSPDQKARYEVA